MAEQVLFSEAARQIREQGGSDADVLEYARANGIPDDEVTGAGERRRSLHIDRGTARTYGATAAGLAALPVTLPAAATGAGAPGAALIELAMIGLGDAAGGQFADLWNKHVAGEDAADPGVLETLAQQAEDFMSGATAGAAGGIAGKAVTSVAAPVALKFWRGTLGKLGNLFRGNAAKSDAFRRTIQQSVAEESAAARATPDIAAAALPSAGAGGPAGMAADASAPGVVAREAAGDMGRPEVAEAIQLLGAPPEGGLPLVTKSRRVQGLWGALARNPESADYMARRVERFMDGLESAHGRALGEIGDARMPKEAAGNKAITAISEAQGKASAAQQPLEREWRAQMGGKGVRVAAPETRAFLAELLAPAKAGGKASANVNVKAFERLAEEIDAGKGTLDLDFARRQRTIAGRNGGLGAVIDDADAGEWDGLFAALSRDFERGSAAADAARGGTARGALAQDAAELSGAAAIPDPEAARRAARAGGPASAAWKALEDNWSGWKARADQIKTVANSKDGYNAFEAAFSGDRKALSRMRALFATVPQDVRNDLTSVYLYNLARDRNGKFSAAAWFSNWGVMDEALKDTLVAPGAPARKYLDALATVGGAMKDTGYTATWGYDTASRTLFQEVVQRGGGIGEAIDTVTSPAKLAVKAGEAAAQRIAEAQRLTPEAQARILTDPHMLKWAYEGMSVPMDKPRAVEKHLDKLGALIARGAWTPDMEPHIAAFLGALKRGLDSARGGKEPPLAPGAKEPAASGQADRSRPGEGTAAGGKTARGINARKPGGINVKPKAERKEALKP